MKFEKSTRILEDIINSQSSHFIKTGLGFDENKRTTKEMSSSKTFELLKKINEENPKGYVDTLKNSINSNTKEGSNIPQKNNFPHKGNHEKFRSFPPRQSHKTRFYYTLFGYFFFC